METLNTPQNAKKTNKQHSGKKLIKRTEIQDSPFTIISQENEHFVTMGNYRISEKCNSIEEAKSLTKINWNLITTVTAIIVEKLIENQNNK